MAPGVAENRRGDAAEDPFAACLAAQIRDGGGYKGLEAAGV